MQLGRVVLILGCVLLGSVAAVEGAATTRPANVAVRAPARPGREGVLEFARYWTGRIKAGQGVRVFAEHYDADAVLLTIFEGRYESLSDADKVRAQQSMQEMMELIHGNAQIQRVMADARFEGFGARGEGGDFEVTFTAVTLDGAKRIPNSMRLVYREGAWKVTDLANNGRYMGPLLREEFRSMPDLSPNECLDEVVKTMRAKLGAR